MSTLTVICSVLFALLLLAGGVAHFARPRLSDGMIPDGLPKRAVHVVTWLVEIPIAVLLLLPGYRIYGLWAFGLLMLFFLPIHIVDFFRSKPVIGNRTVAVVRIGIQLLLIGLAIWLVRANA